MGAVMAATTALSPQVTDPNPALQRPVDVELTLIDAGNLPTRATDSLREEVSALLGSLATVAMIGPDDAAGEVPSVRLKVILMTEPGTRLGVGPDDMGATLRIDGAPSDTVYVFVPVVLRALDSPVRPAATLPAAAIGRALGRVVVHEIIHALAPEVAHAPAGIMKARPNLRDLLAPAAHLDGSSARSLQDGLLARISPGRNPQRR